jgi:hypothetical protein
MAQPAANVISIPFFSFKYAMIYSVRAHYIPEKLAEFHDRLTDGSIRGQEPDGEEICASMTRARVTKPGVVQWTETCYCPTPLEHERKTVYDRYFTDLTATETPEHLEFEGDSFLGLMEHEPGKTSA